MNRVCSATVILALTLTAACQPAAEVAPPVQRIEMQVCRIFTNCLHLWFVAPSPQQGQRIKKQLEEELRDLSRIVSPETSGGMLRLWSLLPENHWFSVNPSVFDLLRFSKQYYKTSEGFFNPAIYGQWVKLWQLDQNRTQKPDSAAIKAVLEASPTMDDVELKGIRLRGHNPKIRIDFGMLLHGHAVDVTHDLLVQENITQFSISMGNTARSRFVKGQKAHMRLAPLHSRVGESVVKLESGEAICSIRTDENPAHMGGLRYARVLNPVTGLIPPSSGAVATVAPSARHASAGCMALFAAGPRRWQNIALKMNLAAALFVSETGKLEMDLPMTQRLNPAK